jgi:hypothetical protein
LLVFLLFFIPFTLSAQRTISGRITDAEDGSPIPGAAVFIASTTVGTTTDVDGYYQLKIPGKGSYQLVVSYVGYQPVTKPDLRTTIHWEPNITTDEEGKANFRFYTADAPSTYSVVIEGVTEDGKIVYKRDKIVVNNAMK